MIVRVQAEGQYRLTDEQAARLRAMDAAVVADGAGTQHPAMHALLGQVVTMVRAEGQPVAHEEVVPSDVLLPAADVTLEEMGALLREHDRRPT